MLIYRYIIVLASSLLLSATAYSEIPIPMGREFVVLDTETRAKPLGLGPLRYGLGPEEGPFNFRMDHQCSIGNRCCQFDEVPCAGTGGPYYAKGDLIGRDIMTLNKYWVEFLPADMDYDECSDYRVTKWEAMAIDHPSLVVKIDRGTGTSFGNICHYRGQNVQFCIGSAVIAKGDIIADQIADWAWAIETVQQDAPQSGGALYDVLDFRTDEHCVP